MVDAKTGEDLTRVVLTQIIVEDAKDAPTGLPLELLRQLIMASDRAGQEFIMWYLKSAFDTYEKVQDAVQDRLKDVRSAALSPLNLVKNLLTLHRSRRRRMNWSNCGGAWRNWSSASKNPSPRRKTALTVVPRPERSEPRLPHQQTSCHA